MPALTIDRFAASGSDKTAQGADRTPEVPPMDWLGPVQPLSCALLTRTGTRHAHTFLLRRFPAPRLRLHGQGIRRAGALVLVAKRGQPRTGLRPACPGAELATGRWSLPQRRLQALKAQPATSQTMSYQVSPIGYLRSCFKEKFAIPRQPQLAPAARGMLELLPPFDKAEALDGLEQVSHVWLLFVFHQALEAEPRLKVRPPRLGGNRSVGVFASRSTHRPNGIGQSVVKLDRIEAGRLWLSGIDLLDGTPILDIKPYLPYADSLTRAHNGIAPTPPASIPVLWADLALEQARGHALRLGEPLVELIEQCLAQDPRPAYQQPEPERRYGVRLWDVDVQWHYPRAGTIRVLRVS
jgi:tRNA-Thr(GGU) m(6)t(6)A37 methyltransferase TsaA